MKTAANTLVCVLAAVCFSVSGISGAEVAGKPPARLAVNDIYGYAGRSYLPYILPAAGHSGNYVEDIDRTNCLCKGKKLYGRVKVVSAFPDLKVKIVDSFPDLKVKVVTSFPDECGKWQFVESFPDFTIQFVDNFPDIGIKFVDSFPGM